MRPNTEMVLIHQALDGVVDGELVTTMREELVPAGTADGYVALGWTLGPAPSPDGRPPKAGKGSGIDAWQAYATVRELSVEGLSRDQIIAVIDEADAHPPITTVVNPGDDSTADESVDEPAPQGPSTTDPEEGDQ